MPPVLTPNHAAELTRQLENMFSILQSNRNIIVPTSVRTFVETIIVESINYRKEEWTEFYDIDFEYYEQIEEAIRSSTETAYNILTEVEPELSEEGETLGFISLINVQVQIHSQWCGIFPFCR